MCLLNSRCEMGYLLIGVQSSFQRDGSSFQKIKRDTRELENTKSTRLGPSIGYPKFPGSHL